MIIVQTFPENTHFIGDLSIDILPMVLPKWTSEEGLIKIEGEDGTEFATLESGDFFGETALISEDKRSANAKALEDSLVIAFFRSDLLEIIRRSPVFGTKILFNLSNIMATRLKRTNKLLQETNPNFNESKYS